MRYERTILADARVFSVAEPYPALMRSLTYLSAATFGLAFWSALILLIFR
jgi:hypothetical protein